MNASTLNAISSIKSWPIAVKKALNTLFSQQGVLKKKEVAFICEILLIDTDTLMCYLVPIAASFAYTPISSYSVGAVIKGVSKETYSSLYLGANSEFLNEPLNASIHAEQSAFLNAWRHGETGIERIAVSASPCGHCRQFLYETLIKDHSFDFLLLNNKMFNQMSFKKIGIHSLLPLAFGPHDLQGDHRLMKIDTPSSIDTSFDEPLQYDHLTRHVYNELNLSYAPYTKNYAACAIQLKNGAIYDGRSVENAAYNPSLLAFSSAFAHLMMEKEASITYPSPLFSKINRVILIERQTTITQKNMTEQYLKSICSHIILEYHSIKSLIP
jgi:cytidine deaminase